jgi:hypothetical protein
VSLRMGFSALGVLDSPEEGSQHGLLGGAEVDFLLVGGRATLDCGCHGCCAHDVRVDAPRERTAGFGFDLSA